MAAKTHCLPELSAGDDKAPDRGVGPAAGAAASGLDSALGLFARLTGSVSATIYAEPRHAGF